MTEREELIARLEALSGPDREVDRHVAVAVGLAKRLSGIAAVEWRPGNTYSVPPAYTASIDAAVALAISKLDSGSVDIEVAYRSVGGRAHGRAEICGPAVYGEGRAANPAIALCIALLRSTTESDK